jgi:NADPH:quinone reductase-like Zn-dependent oxidoreductase
MIQGSDIKPGGGDKMKAVRVMEHGDYDALKVMEVPDPRAQPGEVLVEIKATSINHLDTWVRRGVPGHKFPLPITTGSDGAGVVVELGEGVEGPVPGDRVAISPGFSCGCCEACLSGRDHYCRQYGIFGESCDGTNCDLISVPMDCILPLPENLDFAEAASVLLVFLTAWEMLVVKARIKGGDTVLVQAAGSGVGSAAIQIARYFNARVIASAGNDTKLEKARELGATEVINYNEQDLPGEMRILTEKRGADIIVDHLGQETFQGSMRSLAQGGRLVTCGATTGPEFSGDLRPLFFKNLSLLGSTMGSRGTLPEILRLVNEGIFRPVIDRVLPMSEAAQGHRLIAGREQFGKIVLKPW